MAYDLVIRGGRVIGADGDQIADVAVSGGRITEVGKGLGHGKEEIDARGKLVTPGFVDVHTHYDGQVTWSQDITPSSQNGVTTAIMGNCGVGFAPCRPADHVRLIQLMDGQGAPADRAQPSYKAMITPDGLKAVAAYAYGIGPGKEMLWSGATPTTLVADAHAAGLRVHPWTYRAENYFEPERFRRGADPAAHGDIACEIDAGLAQGIDGFFTDFPLYGAQARDRVRTGVK